MSKKKKKKKVNTPKKKKKTAAAKKATKSSKQKSVQTKPKSQQKQSEEKPIKEKTNKQEEQDKKKVSKSNTVSKKSEVSKKPKTEKPLKEKADKQEEQEKKKTSKNNTVSKKSEVSKKPKTEKPLKEKADKPEEQGKKKTSKSNTVSKKSEVSKKAKTDIKENQNKKESESLDNKKEESNTKENIIKKVLNSKKEFEKKHRKIYLGFWMTILISSLCGLIYGGYHIFSWDKDNKSIDKQIKFIEKDLVINEIEPSDNDEIVNPPEEETIDKSSDYWTYINLPLINVDFTELMKKNDDTVAYISLGGTNINYPVVQAEDNDFYLTHSYDKTYNDAGWVFLDYRNDINNLQDNTIIYGHGRTNTTMFGSLKNIFRNEWYQNTDNYVVKISTPKENTLWQVFSVYSIPTETYYLTSEFGSDKRHQKFIDTIIGRSRYNFNVPVNTNDKILTLSTCYSNEDKVVLHAKLIKKQTR